MGPTGYNEKQCIFDSRAASVVRLQPLESRHSNRTLLRHQDTTNQFVLLQVCKDGQLITAWRDELSYGGSWPGKGSYLNEIINDIRAYCMDINKIRNIV